MDGLTKAIEAAGGVSKLARSLGMRQSAVGNWRARNGVPPRHCLAVEHATGVSRYELRPDIFGADPESKAA
jgi:DNA-binding transcriptional regulator YdaS (Cro superfamily)